MTPPKETFASRYAVCLAGNGFSVEDRRSGERVGYYRTQAAAERAADKARDAAREAAKKADLEKNT